MCEFKVFLGSEEVFEGAVYAKATESSVLLKDILGSSKKIDNSKIMEVDVTKEKLILTKV